MAWDPIKWAKKKPLSAELQAKEELAQEAADEGLSEEEKKKRKIERAFKNRQQMGPVEAPNP